MTFKGRNLEILRRLSLIIVNHCIKSRLRLKQESVEKNKEDRA